MESLFETVAAVELCAAEECGHAEHPGGDCEVDGCECSLGVMCEQCSHPQHTTEGEHRLCPSQDCLCYGLVGGSVLDWCQLELIAAKHSPMLVHPIVSSSGLSILTGEPGCGKSMVGLDIALSLTLGDYPQFQTFHNFPIDHPQPRGVLYLDAENSEGMIAQRTLAWLTQHNLPREAAKEALTQRFRYQHSVEFGLGGSSDEDGLPDKKALYQQRIQPEIELRLRSGRPEHALVVADTMGTLMTVEDSNSQQQLKAVMDELEYAADQLECPMLVLTHPSKEGATRNATRLVMGLEPNSQDSVSGAFTVAGRALAISVMAKKPGDDQKSLLALSKLRDGEKPNKVWALKIEGVKLTDAEGQPLAAQHDQRELVAGAVPPDEWEVHKKMDSKFPAFMKWLQGKKASPTARLAISDCKKGSGCPVSEKTVRKYVTEPEHEPMREQFGLRVERVSRSGGGSARVEFWLDPDTAVDWGEMDSEAGGE